MSFFRQAAFVCIAAIAPSTWAQPSPQPDADPRASQSVSAQASQLFVLGNQARAANGFAALRWDPQLAEAAMRHCLHMVHEGQLAHRYAGELDVTERAARAGAHFSLIEENIALGPDAADIHEGAEGIHQGWMRSPGHRANLLSPEIDSVGIAVIVSSGNLYAVSDYARAVPVLTPAQVEAGIAAALRARGLAILPDPAAARAWCVSSASFAALAPGSRSAGSPDFLMRWQNADPSQLPPDLVARLASGVYRKAAVGNCPPQSGKAAFTAYRVAVLLYQDDSAASPAP